METVCPSYITHNLVSTNIILLMLLKAYSSRGWVSSGPIGFSTISIHIAMILKNWLSIHHFILYMTAWFISPPPPLQLAMCVKSLQDGSSYTFTEVIYLLYFRKGWQKKIIWRYLRTFIQFLITCITIYRFGRKLFFLVTEFIDTFI